MHDIKLKEKNKLYGKSITLLSVVYVLVIKWKKDNSVVCSLCISYEMEKV